MSRTSVPNSAILARILRSACVLSALMLCSGQLASGQEPPADEKPEPTTEAAATITPDGPDTTIWINDNGVPRPVVGVSYDDFTKAWRAYKGLNKQDSATTFAIASFSAQGAKHDGYAEFTVSIEIDARSQLVQAPLGLGKAILTGQPVGLKKDDSFGYSEEGESYLVTLVGEGRRTLELTLMVPITTTGATSKLSLTVPRSNVSAVTVKLPNEVTEAIASDNAILSHTSTKGASILTARGGVGDLRLQWRNPSQATDAPQTVVLTAEGEISTRVDGGSARSSARFSVRSFGGPFEDFRIRLPRDAKRLPVAGAQSSQVRDIRPVPGSENLFTVSLREKTMGPISVEFRVEQAIGLNGDRQADNGRPQTPGIDLAGFEVVGAVRQYGSIAIQVDEDSQLRWGKLLGARRIAVDELPESLQSREVTSAVRYFRQNCDVPVEVLQRGTRIDTLPQYRLEIHPDEAVLEVAVKYQITGAPVLGFSFDMGDWTELTPDPIEIGGLIDAIDQQRLFQSEDGLLDIPLLRSQAGAVEVKFRARRDLAQGDELIDLILPRPLTPGHEAVRRSRLVVTVDPGTLLKFEPAMLRRFQPVATPPADVAPEDSTGLRTFVFRGEPTLILNEPPRIVATKTRRAGEQHVRVSTDVSIEDERSIVRQSFHYDLRYQSVERLAFYAPEDIRGGEGLSLRIVSRTTDDVATPGVISVPLSWILNVGADSMDTIEVDLPRPWLGELEIQAEYESARGALDLNSDNGLRIAMLTPVDAEQLRHEAHFLPVREISPALASAEASAWRASELVEGRKGLMLATDTEQPYVTLLRANLRSVQEPNTVVRKVWRQSWLRSGKLQHRAVWQIVNSVKSATITLPSDIDPRGVEVLLDGAPLAPRSAEDGRITLSISETTALSERTIELRYLENAADHAIDNLTLNPPVLSGDNSVATSFWQIVLPRSRWLLGTPDSYSKAWEVAWMGGRFVRRQSMSCEELEQFIGASHQGLSLAPSEHAYLFSALEDPGESVSITTASRSMTILAASVGILAYGLLLMYVSNRWRGLVLWVGVAAVMATAAIFPGEFVLSLQAGLLGVAALLVAWLLIVTLQPRRQSPVELSGDSTSIRRPVSPAETSITIGAGGSAGSHAATVSMHADDPAH